MLKSRDSCHHFHSTPQNLKQRNTFGANLVPKAFGRFLVMIGKRPNTTRATVWVGNQVNDTLRRFTLVSFAYCCWLIVCLQLIALCIFQFDIQLYPLMLLSSCYSYIVIMILMGINQYFARLDSDLSGLLVFSSFANTQRNLCQRLGLPHRVSPLPPTSSSSVSAQFSLFTQRVGGQNQDSRYHELILFTGGRGDALLCFPCI